MAKLTSTPSTAMKTVAGHVRQLYFPFAPEKPSAKRIPDAAFAVRRLWA